MVCLEVVPFSKVEIGGKSSSIITTFPLETNKIRVRTITIIVVANYNVVGIKTIIEQTSRGTQILV